MCDGNGACTVCGCKTNAEKETEDKDDEKGKCVN